MNDHSTPHLDDEGHCLCECPACVTDWQPTLDGASSRRRCQCPECNGGNCPNWRLDSDLHALVTGTP